MLEGRKEGQDWSEEKQPLQPRMHEEVHTDWEPKLGDQLPHSQSWFTTLCCRSLWKTGHAGGAGKWGGSMLRLTEDRGRKMGKGDWEAPRRELPAPHSQSLATSPKLCLCIRPLVPHLQAQLSALPGCRHSSRAHLKTSVKTLPICPLPIVGSL